MQIHVKLVAVALILVASTESKPVWSTVYVTNYEPYKEPEELSVQPQAQILQYHDAYSPYYLYNAHPDTSGAPHAVVSSEKTTISHFPSFSVYLGTPVYNIRIPLHPMPHEKKTPQEETTGEATPLSTTTMKPGEATESSVERLDTKNEPKMEKKEPCMTSGNAEDDSVTVDAI